jgi:DNA-binding winged helix-turn-helix (wHTH) protein
METARSPQRTLSLALIDCEGAHGIALQDRLHSMGHQSSTFAQTSSLLAALGDGQRFDLLVHPPLDEITSASLSAVCKVLGMPTLLIVQEGQWSQLLSRQENSACTDVLDFDGSRTTNEELSWRIRALVQRSNEPVSPRPGRGELVWGSYQFHEGSCTVLLRGRQILLQPRELSFALQLFRNIGRILPRDWLRRTIWKTSPWEESRTIDSCAASLRKKLELRQENGFLLRAVYKQGYQLVAVPSEVRPKD